MAAKQKFHIGDRVMYSAKFLRSIGDYSYETASRRMTISSLEELRPGLCYCKMVDDNGDECRALDSNLQKVKAA